MTAEQLMSGESQPRAVTRGDVETKALPEGPVDLGADLGPTRDEYGNEINDDEVVEAEIVEDDAIGWDTMEEAKASGQRFKKNRGEGRAYVPS